MKIISFGHKVPGNIKEEIRKQYPQSVFVEVRFHLEMMKPLVPQILKLIVTIMKNDEEIPFVILPGTSVASGIIMGVLLGYFGRMPNIVEIIRDRDESWKWVLKEIHNMDRVKNEARLKRWKPK